MIGKRRKLKESRKTTGLSTELSLEAAFQNERAAIGLRRNFQKV